MAMQTKSTETHTPFRASYEHLYDRDDDDSRPPALLINGGAAAMALAAAALARATRLSKSLNLWSRTDEEDLTIAEVADTLEPLAKEIELLLGALVGKFK